MKPLLLPYLDELDQQRLDPVDTISWDDLDEHARERLDALLRQLPGAEEHIIRMRGMGMTQAAIGQALVPKVSQWNVGQRLRRAQARLQWLMTMPPVPETYDSDLEAVLTLPGKSGRRHTVPTRVAAVKDAVEATNVRRSAITHGLNDVVVWQWCQRAMRAEGPTGQYVRHRLTNGRMGCEQPRSPRRVAEI